MKGYLSAGLLLFGLVSGAHAAETCGWLATARLDEAFPDAAPWQTMVGGKVGHCQFTSNPHQPVNIFGANQTVKGSAAEAEDMVRSLRANTADAVIQPAPALGKYAFTYAPKPSSEERAGRSLFFVAHHGKVMVMGSLVMQKAIGPAERAAAEKLVQAALAIADDPHAIAAAGKCPYFDAALVRRLLPGKDYEENVYGSNSCMAQSGSKALILSIVADGRAGEVLANMNKMSGGCKSEELIQLGKDAQLSYACSSGNPRAMVRFADTHRMLEFSFAPEREPTPAERELLVQLAEKAAR
jgi:hypothetical protein